MNDSTRVTEAITNAATDIGAIAKNQRVQAGPARFTFRGIDDVLNAIHGPLVKHGVSIVPRGFDVIDNSVTETKKGAHQQHLLGVVHYRVYGPAGDFVEAAVVAEALDTSDKASSKMMSMAYKYLAFQMFSIPVEGALLESDQDSTERGDPTGGHQPPAHTDSGPTPAEIRGHYENAVRILGITVEEASAAWRKNHGNITVDEFWALPVGEIVPHAREVVMEAKAKQEVEK